MGSASHTDFENTDQVTSLTVNLFIMIIISSYSGCAVFQCSKKGSDTQLMHQGIVLMTCYSLYYTCISGSE